MRMWDIVRASIVLDGPFAPSDRVHIRTNFMNNDLRDTYGLFKWADDIGNKQSAAAQVKVSGELADWSMLDTKCTQDELVSHCTDLLSLWLDVTGNVESAPTSYYVRLLASLPVAPVRFIFAHLGPLGWTLRIHDT